MNDENPTISKQQFLAMLPGYGPEPSGADVMEIVTEALQITDDEWNEATEAGQ